MVDGSRWYVWTSSSGYTKCLAPYDLGIHGLAAAGDIDGDGKADPIVIVGSDWYVWFSSAGYQRFGPYTMNLP
jgi:hypothetical protein